MDAPRQPSQPPLSFSFSAAEIVVASESAITESQRKLDELSQASSEYATFANVLDKLADADNELQLTGSLIELLSKVATDVSVREACHHAADQLNTHKKSWYKHKDLARLVDDVFLSCREGLKLDVEDTKLLSDTRRTFHQNGILMAETDAIKLSELQSRIREIEHKFASSLDREDHDLFLDAAGLEGVPEIILNPFQAQEGLYRIPLGGPDCAGILGFADRAETREKIYRANVARGKENIPLMEEVTKLRQEKARLSGYRTHAELVLQNKMAKSPETVQDFLGQVKRRVAQQIQTELAELRRLRLHGSEDITSDVTTDLAFWDLPYYARMLRRERTRLREEDISGYFPLLRTLGKMLDLFGHLFGLKFERLDTAVPAQLVWHEDVIAYTVWDSAEEGGDFVGYLYLDLYSRSGKSGMPHCHPLQAGFVKLDGTRHFPSTVLITSFEPPAVDTERLLQHSEVVLVFHELGHGIHDLVGKCKYARYHGADTAADFNESPSQMLEEWCWNTVGLQKLSSHHITHETMPASMIEALIQSRNVAPMVSLIPQLRITFFDHAIHGSMEGDNLDLSTVYKTCFQIEGIGDVDEEVGFGTYRHLMMGYDGCMYSYLWSKAIAQDMFETMFKNDPLNSTMGRRYRHMILEKGGSADEMQLLTAFLGRPLKLEGFLS
ncbi:Peptidase family M3-like protein 2 [Elsinoe fawcettii]|nr:Peptidase family M3-like protein 2 [Elsinoe fawcettii]